MTEYAAIWMTESIHHLTSRVQQEQEMRRKAEEEVDELRKEFRQEREARERAEQRDERANARMDWYANKLQEEARQHAGTMERVKEAQEAESRERRVRERYDKERERAEQLKRSWRVAESNRLCNAYNLACMQTTANTIASELEEVERERDELHLALHRLWLEAKCHAGASKHLMRECEAAGRLVGTRPRYKDE